MPDKPTFDLLLEARMQQLAASRQQTAPPPEDLQREVFRTLDLLAAVDEMDALPTATLPGAATEFIDLIENPEGTLPPHNAAGQ
jgi:hypothetical protein